MIDWISVKDKLPDKPNVTLKYETSNPLLLCGHTNHKWYSLGQFQVAIESGESFFTIGSGYCDQYAPFVTHYAYLEEPKDE